MAFTWTPDLADPELFHITHVDNLASIVAQGGLLSDARIASGQAHPTTIGDQSIKSRRQLWTLNLPDRPMVGHFVPFYFCPRSVMLYRVRAGHAGWRGGQDGIVHLVTRVSLVRGLGTRCIFTDRNAATSYHEASEDLALLPTLVDWSVMSLETWRGDPQVARQAEFLVGDFVPWESIARIVVRDSATAQRVNDVLQGSQQPAVDLDPSWYY